MIVQGDGTLIVGDAVPSLFFCLAEGSKKPKEFENGDAQVLPPTEGSQNCQDFEHVGEVWREIGKVSGDEMIWWIAYHYENYLSRCMAKY